MKHESDFHQNHEFSLSHARPMCGHERLVAQKALIVHMLQARKKKRKKSRWLLSILLFSGQQNWEKVYYVKNSTTQLGREALCSSSASRGLRACNNVAGPVVCSHVQHEVTPLQARSTGAVERLVIKRSRYLIL